MKIKIIRNMTRGIAEEVWRASRSKDSPVDEIYKIDAPVNEFPLVTLSIDCTLLEREVFTSFRDHVIWARTSRVDNPIMFIVDRHFHSIEYDQYRERMKEAIENGVSQDEYRMLLPVVSLTSFTCQMSTRSLAKLWHAFDGLAEDCENDKVASLFSSARDEITDVLEQIGLEDMTRHMKPIDPFPQIDVRDSGSVGDTVVVTVLGSFALRAQVARHRNLQLKDSMKEFCENADLALIDDTVEMQVSASVDFWNDIISKRNCWLAQHDLWLPLIRAAEAQIGKIAILPCSMKNGTHAKCPYEKDARLRYTMNDPNPPCPMHAYLNDIEFDDYAQEARDMVARDNRPQFWHSIISSTRREK